MRPTGTSVSRSVIRPRITAVPVRGGAASLVVGGGGAGATCAAVTSSSVAIRCSSLTSNLIRGASPLGLPYTRSRAPLRRRAPIAWLARGARSHLGMTDRVYETACSLIRGASPPGPPCWLARGGPSPRSALQAHSLPLVRTICEIASTADPDFSLPTLPLPTSYFLHFLLLLPTSTSRFVLQSSQLQTSHVRLQTFIAVSPPAGPSSAARSRPAECAPRARQFSRPSPRCRLRMTGTPPASACRSARR